MITWNKKFSSYVLSIIMGLIVFLFLSFVLFFCFGFFGQNYLQLVEVKIDRFSSINKNNI